MVVLGQLTDKDCWISSTIVAIFLVLDYIPSIRLHNTDNETIVEYRNGRKITLMYPPRDYRDAIIRATRVYFSDPKSSLQSQFDISKINYRGCPDLVSNLFFGKDFEVWSTNYISFYTYASISTIRTFLYNRKRSEIFLLTFNFNPSHLYVFLSLKDNLLEVIDISSGECIITTIPLKLINVLMRLNIRTDRLHEHNPYQFQSR